MDYSRLDRSGPRARRLVAAALILAIALTLAGMSSASAGSGSGSGWSSSGGSFALTANYQLPTFTGAVIRGGLASCPDCTTSVAPRYLGTSFTCFYDSNSLSLTSLNGFSGTVTLELLGLPNGVTSQTAVQLTVPRRGSVSTPFKLQASIDATLGTATITVRATSGGQARTLSLPITVADRLPGCP